MAAPPTRPASPTPGGGTTDDTTTGGGETGGGEVAAALRKAGFAGEGTLSGREVFLARSIEGVYEPGRCGPGCQLGTIEWWQGGDSYGVGVADASLAELTAFANEAISAPPTSP